MKEYKRHFSASMLTHIVHVHQALFSLNTRACSLSSVTWVSDEDPEVVTNDKCHDEEKTHNFEPQT